MLILQTKVMNTTEFANYSSKLHYVTIPLHDGAMAPLHHILCTPRHYTDKTPPRYHNIPPSTPAPQLTAVHLTPCAQREGLPR